jgi:drug/metabolite transporter (DMT)-like permease
LPALALIFNAFVWGVSWFPFRQLEGHGLHPVWATCLIYAAVTLAMALLRRGAWGLFARQPALLGLGLAAGLTNVGFNWAVTQGDVVRVVLLFYLMPLWSLLLARVILKEKLTPSAIVRVAMALAGAALVLSHGSAEGGGAVRGGLLPDVLAVLGGFAFALNNVMLKRESAQPEEGRALAMFLGGAAVAGGTAVALSTFGGAGVQWPVAAASWVLPALGLSFAFMASNLCLQYGAARLSAAATAVVMPCEVLFAALTSVWWGGATLHASVLVGGALILAATLASVLERR